MEAAIMRRYSAQKDACRLWGICGGYQMLGERIIDETGVEESAGSMRGMGLIPMATYFHEEKTRTQVEGTICPTCGGLAGAPFTGYEIHMGESRYEGEQPELAMITDKLTGESRTEGYASERVCGTYVHGIFDRHELVEALVASLAAAKGIKTPASHLLDYRAYKETQYDLLAEGLRGALDMERIYDMIEKGV